MTKKEWPFHRTIVCPNCGALYDIYYIDNIQFRKGSPDKVKCENCGMVPVVYKDLSTFEESDAN